MAKSNPQEPAAADRARWAVDKEAGVSKERKAVLPDRVPHKDRKAREGRKDRMDHSTDLP